MLSDMTLDLVMSHTDNFKRKSFLETFTDKELIEALTWFRENKPRNSKGRQSAIVQELKDREQEIEQEEKKANPFRLDPVAGARFADAWEKTTTALREVMHCG